MFFRILQFVEDSVALALRCLRWPLARWQISLLKSKLAEIRPNQSELKLTVLIPYRDRSAEQLCLLFKSLAEQTLPTRFWRTLVIDYGSDAEHVKVLDELSHRYSFEVLRVEETGVWNRGRALNIGLQAVETPFVLLGHVDLFFQAQYLSTAIDVLEGQDNQMVGSRMMDLSRSFGTASRRLQEKSALAYARPRLNLPFHPSVLVLPTWAIRLIRGFDERFQLWGYEDLDLHARLKLLGLRLVNISGRSEYFHQYHEKYAGVIQEKELTRTIVRNRFLYLSEPRLLRNPTGWGKAHVAMLPAKKAKAVGGS